MAKFSEIQVDKMDVDQSQLWRMKSAMVLYEIERCLGNFVCSEATEVNLLSSQSVYNIQTRELEKNKEFDSSNLAKIVAATYLDEVFGFAQNVAKGRPEAEHLNELRKLFSALDVFSIRNAISHPNRDFHPSYWYRIAAIANDPAIDKLRFQRVIRAFRDAESGRLASPPESWINAPIWSLPNNLPEQFDHDITGLIARQRENDELNRLIQNERLNLIAIVAPGGTGKTALLLHSLQEIILSPQSTEWVDRIFYFSSKTEFLTSEGLVNHSPITSSIEGIKASIAEVFMEQEGLESLTFEEVCLQFKTNRLLLCLDNLETVLRDGPNEFDEFYQDLPRNWRVIVTSRVTVNSATIMPLSPLSLKGAVAFAWNYLSKRGGESVSEDELKNVVNTCDRNPLAIRLTLDGFIAGKKSLAEMQTLAKQQVIDFSYRNLIEALSSTVHELLECLFVISEPVSRTQACTLLNRDLDEISEAFNKVRGTSLVSRIPGQIEEKYILSSSIRDFLVIRPINLEIRDSVQSEIRKTKIRISEIAKSQQNSNPLQKDYIPDQVPPTIKVVAADALKICSRNRSSQDLFDALEKLRQTVKVQDHSLLHRAEGLILLKLNDRSTAKKELQKAFDMDPVDVAAGLVLSMECRKDQELEEAFELANKLFELGWDDPLLSDPYEVGLLMQSYYLPLIWQGETEQVLDGTNNWKTTKGIHGILGTLRAMAFRYSVELERDIELVQTALCKAIEVLDQVFNLDGYAGLQIREGMKLIDQLVYVKRGQQELSETSKQQFIDFMDRHLLTLAQQHYSYSIDSPEVIQWIQEMSNLTTKDLNPFTTNKWQRLLDGKTSKNPVNSFDEVDSDWIQVFVERRPKPDRQGKNKPFLFAQDKDKKKYFVHRNVLEFGESLWDNINVSDVLEIVPETYPPDPESGKYPKAVAAQFPA